jgi:CheY-like chemotaxis protein
VNQSLALAHLKQLGCQVVVANNGLEAVDAHAREEFDLILMDCQMPEMDGYEATRVIRAREGDGPRIPIIAVTANAMQGDREVCLACGMDDFLSKPYKQRQLRDLLDRWTQAAPTREMAPADIEPSSEIHAAATAPTPGAEPTMDSAVLDEMLRQFGAENLPMIQELIAIYLDNAPKLLAEMESALAAASAKDLMRAAHTLKSSSASVGAMRLSVLAKSIELAAREGQLDGLAAPVGDCRAEFDGVRLALSARLK